MNSGSAIDSMNAQYGALDVATCSHCGLPVPSGLVDANAVDQFCCVGCRIVHGAIRAHGLERYYCIRDGKREPASPSERDYQEFDAESFLETHSQRAGDGLRSVDLFLEGVHCSACVWLVEKLPRVAPGVVEARLDLGRASVRVVWEEGKTNLSRIARELDALGYSPHVVRDAKSRALRQREDRRLLIKIAIAGAGAGNVMLLAFALYGGSFHGMEDRYSALFRWMSLAIGLVVLLGPGAMFFRGAFAAMRTRTAHLDLPIAIGLGAGTVAGTINTILDRGEIYFDSLTGLVFLLLVSRYLQRRLERRATESVERLFSLTPSTARLRTEDGVQIVPIEALQLDHLVEVRAGESFPADGRVVEGESSIDMSLLTGESRPVPLSRGGGTFAGSLNLERPVVVRVTALGRETRVGRLLSLMQECARRRAPIVRLADRFAGYFTVASMVLFVATIAIWQFVDAKRAIDHAVTLLIVNCPCGLGLATPFAVSIALGRAARSSILIKGGEVLEKLSVTRRQKPTLFLDKTGTLTEPGLSVIEWHGAAELRGEMAAALAAIEAQVAHPIANAFTKFHSKDGPLDRGDAVRTTASVPAATLVRADRAGIEGLVDGRRLLAGSEAFVRSQCRQLEVLDGTSTWAARVGRELARKCLTPVWVCRDDEVVAVVGIGSQLRHDAASTVSAMKARGFHVAILSGDDQETVTAVGRQLALPAEDCHGGLTPEAKLHIVEEAAASGPVLMVGDGVNDAAALTAATVGIAVQGGAEASLTAADVYLGRAGVGVLVELLDGSSRTIAVIRRCLAVSLAYNVVAAALAMSGVVNALIAAVLMPMASFTVLGIALASKTFAPAHEYDGSPLPRLGS